MLGLLQHKFGGFNSVSLYKSFFQGCRVWQMDRHNKEITNVRNIAELWSDVPCNIDAAYRSNKDGYIYFFKGNYF